MKKYVVQKYQVVSLKTWRLIQETSEEKAVSLRLDRSSTDASIEV